MIIVQLKGGLGNQLFQYATGRALAIKRNENLWLDLSYLEADPKGAYTKRHFELDQLNYKATIAKEDQLQSFRVSSLFDKVLNKAGLKPNRLFNENQQNYIPEFENLTGNVLLNGYWQSEKYFSEIRSQLLQEISPCYEFSDHGKFVLEKIVKSGSVGIHVRRGDYISLKEANDFHGTCDITYYKEALTKLKERFSDLTVFVFSDDITWCRSTFSFLENVVFVDAGNDKKSGEDLFIMSKCKHNIIANSSYSWWAAWLNQNKDTVTVAPKNWFRNTAINTSDLYPKNWILL